MEKKKILITGSLGLVGSACVDLFTKQGWQVVGLDNNGRSQFFGVKETPIYPDVDTVHNDVDIRDLGRIMQIFQAYKFDAIIHAAGQPSHDYATDHVFEDFTVNTLGTLNLLEATRTYCPEATFVYVSTDKVYGENMGCDLVERETRYETIKWEEGFDESLGLDFAGKRSLFGCSKAAADIYVQEYGNYFGMNTACFRPGCITGKNHKGSEQHGFLAYLVKCIKNGTTYKIFGNGKNVRDQIHANDLANVFFYFVERPKTSAVYNMGGGPERSISVLEAGEMIAKKMHKPFKYEFHPERKGDRCWDVHDVSKFRKDYPEWDYKYSLEDIINDLIQA